MSNEDRIPWADLLGAQMAREAAPAQPMTALQAHARALDLAERLAAFNRPRPAFRPGELVTLRQDTYVPYKLREGEPAIVVETGLDPYLHPKMDDSFRVATMAIGYVDREGDFLTVVVDPRYFDRWQDPYETQGAPS